MNQYQNQYRNQYRNQYHTGNDQSAFGPESAARDVFRLILLISHAFVIIRRPVNRHIQMGEIGIKIAFFEVRKNAEKR